MSVFHQTPLCQSSTTSRTRTRLRFTNMLIQEIVQKVRKNVRLSFAVRKVRMNLTSRARRTRTQAIDHTEYANATLNWIRLTTLDSNVRMGVSLKPMAPNGARTAVSAMCRTRRQTRARESDHDRGERTRASWVAPAVRSRRSARLSPSPQQWGVGPNPHPSLSGSAGRGGQQRPAGARTPAGCARG